MIKKKTFKFDEHIIQNVSFSENFTHLYYSIDTHILFVTQYYFTVKVSATENFIPYAESSFWIHWHNFCSSLKMRRLENGKSKLKWPAFPLPSLQKRPNLRTCFEISWLSCNWRWRCSSVPLILKQILTVKFYGTITICSQIKPCCCLRSSITLFVSFIVLILRKMLCFHIKWINLWVFQLLQNINSITFLGIRIMLLVNC